LSGVPVRHGSFTRLNGLDCALARQGLMPDERIEQWAESAALTSRW